MRSAQDSKSMFRGQLEKATKSMMKKDDHIFELTEEGRDQYTFDWSRARLKTLRQYRNDKLVDKEVDAEILQLTSYFYNAKDKEDKGRLDEVVEAMTCQADDEEAIAKESQEEAKKTIDERPSECCPPQSIFTCVFLFLFLNSFPEHQNFFARDNDLRLLGCNFEQLSFALI